MNELAAELTIADLRRLTNESVDAMLALLAEAADADIVFVPDDPDASDTYAVNPMDRDLAWTLGHNVVHATASAEEYAAVAAELARGVPFHGRSRSETPWQTITTIAQCRARLEESRRMRLASLELWPGQPNLEEGYMAWKGSGWVNAKGIFAWGLAHDDDHRRQIANILEQAREARTVAS